MTSSAWSEGTASVAVLNWVHLLEDFLDPLQISFHEFRETFRGSWIFGYASALQRVGIRPVLFFVSARTSQPVRFTHAPTGTTCWILGASTCYRAVRRRIPNPYAASLEKAVGNVSGPKRLVAGFLKEAAPYLATPLKQLAQKLESEGCGALLCQEYENPRFDVCSLFAPYLNVSVFGTFQGGDRHAGRIESLVRPLSLRLAERMIIASDAEARRVQARYGLPTERISRIPNPIDVNIWSAENQSEARRHLGVARDAKVAVWHGRVMYERKGLDVLLDAWDLVCARGDHTSGYGLLMLGSGADSNRLRRRLQASVARETIHWIEEFTQEVPRIRRVLSAGDVYVLPSRHEGFAVAPLEAMACGLPVVGADVSGVRDVIPDESAGGVVVPKGDPEVLASQLLRLFSDPVLMMELGRHARARVVSEYSMEAVGHRLRDLFFPSGPSFNQAAPSTPTGERV